MPFEWNLDEECWQQDDQGAFNLVHWGITQQPVEAQLDKAIACHVGARLCFSHGFFPAKFRYCPKCGKLMPEPPRVEGRWWPPVGDNPTSAYPRVFLEVTIPLAVVGWEDGQINPSELRLPGAGDYRFLVGEFGTRSSAMIAINIRGGHLHCLETDSSTSQWCELEPESQSLGHWECNDWRKSLAWAVAWTRDDKLLLPTDEGLTGVQLDLINRRYRSERLCEQPCLGSPAFLGTSLLAPTTLGLCAVVDDEAKNVPIESSCAIKLTDYYHPPIIEKDRLIWLNHTGQLIVERNGVAPRYIPWPADFEPRFNLATSYLAPDGQWWQLGFDHATEKYCFVQLSAGQQLIPTDGPRRIAGRICVRREQWSDRETAPWREKEEWSISREIRGAEHSDFHPLLYSREEIIGLLRRGQPQDSDRIFLLDRGNRVRLPQQELCQISIPGEPCLGQFVVYDRMLYFYYPGWGKLIGWALA
ncbi:MAG: hypothetical protein D4R73_07620 [Deltaproteobacteria bacterium]|nr:MAG: hypothetical protein D4R73_07620 [Deltaproteobacteria bacterium]